MEAESMGHSVGNSITYHIAGARGQAEGKVVTLQSSPSAIRQKISRLPWERWHRFLYIRA